MVLFSVSAFAKVETFNLEIMEKPLNSQLALISKIYKKPIIMDSSVILKKVTISAKNLTDTEAKNIIAKALSLGDISIMESPKEVTFLYAKDAYRSGLEVFKNNIENPLPERMATLILDLPKEMRAVDLEKYLRSLCGSNSGMSANDQRNQLMITDWTSNLVRLKEIALKTERAK